MTKSEWSNQGHTLSIMHGDVCYHFHADKRHGLVGQDSLRPVELEVVESLSGTWSVQGDTIGYAELPEAVKEELAELECVVIQ